MDGAQGFHLSFYCCMSLRRLLGYVRRPKALVAMLRPRKEVPCRFVSKCSFILTPFRSVYFIVFFRSCSLAGNDNHVITYAVLSTFCWCSGCWFGQQEPRSPSSVPPRGPGEGCDTLVNKLTTTTSYDRVNIIFTL